jgi:hypothetical protein
VWLKAFGGLAFPAAKACATIRCVAAVQAHWVAIASHALRFFHFAQGASEEEVLADVDERPFNASSLGTVGRLAVRSDRAWRGPPSDRS